MNKFSFRINWGFFLPFEVNKEVSNSTFDILDFSPKHGFQRSERREYWMKGEFLDWLIIPTIHRVSEQISSEGSLAAGCHQPSFTNKNISLSNLQYFCHF
jgi:hypothetical protein